MAKRYGWGPEMVADLTPFQQVMYLRDENETAKTVSFRDEKEFEQWATQRK